MGGPDARIEAAGGMDDGSIGTDAARVMEAIQRAMGDDGVLVLMDLGSALMSAEMAVEMLGTDRVALSEAPLVEGAVAAAASARGGASLEEVSAEARGALGMKAAQLGVSDAGSGVSREAEPVAEPDASARVPVVNEIGLHARPAALVVELAAKFDAELRLAKPGGRSVSAKSLTGLMTLSARLGDELEVSASGPQAAEAVAAFEELAKEGFGEGVALRPSQEPRVSRHEEAPSAGTRLRGIPASTGIAIGPARQLGSRSGPPPPREAEGEEAELRRLDEARASARSAIEADRDQVARRTGPSEAAIFAAHLALLDDDALLSRAREKIGSGAT